jgi:hypothetical protein
MTGIYTLSMQSKNVAGESVPPYSLPSAHNPLPPLVYLARRTQSEQVVLSAFPTHSQCADSDCFRQSDYSYSEY